MIRNDWALINDCEIITRGTKKECIKVFESVDRPWAFNLVKIEKETKLKPRWQ